VTKVSTNTFTERVIKSGDHNNFCLTAGPDDGVAVVLVHGWPELALSWRNQIPVLAGLGLRVIAPDMRGYGRSTVYQRHEDYALEHIVGDMIGLLDSLDEEKAIFVGHDWGSPVVWSIASHHPERCHGVASLCVPYYTLERGLDAMLPLINREIYPEDEFPLGQFEYMRFYEEDFDKSIAPFNADPMAAITALFRSGNPAAKGEPSRTAFVRKDNGWFKGDANPPRTGLDTDVIDEDDLEVYAESLARNGFFGPGSYYMNHAANADYAGRALNDGVLEMPALFIAAEYDQTCESIDSRLAEPMAEKCRDLTTRAIKSGHWMAQEKPTETNAELIHWMASSLGG
jgi:pimeloyl-ACP methyl ester carboxylesterase